MSGFFFVLYVLLLLVFFFLMLPLFLYKLPSSPSRTVSTCHIHSHPDIIRGDGYVIVQEILTESCRQRLVHTYLEECRRNKQLNEDRDLDLYVNETFQRELSDIVGDSLYPVHSLDLQRCWLRYYFEGMKAQYYENYHHDVKRYRSGIKQYRFVLPLYDTSDTKFTIDGYGEFDFKQNMGVFLEASNCLHKVRFTKGERLLLFMDFITKECNSLYDHYQCRGVHGYLNWIRDSVWRNISSLYYHYSNHSHGK